ncbi:MAG: transposase zinc-binding domain-containing protein, partial [Burkholderiales bacterium]
EGLRLTVGALDTQRQRVQLRDSKGNQERFVPRPAATWQICRTTQSPVMLAQCAACESPIFVPHSWGHRNAPHCPHPESQQGLERQLKKQLPAEYFLLTFTVPEAFRALAWQPQRTLYSIMTRCRWESVTSFTRNDPRLQGAAGATAVRHTCLHAASTTPRRYI